MSDVARLAKVSVKTVSRVVNDEPNVRPETRQRVDDAISRLGFLRNDGASQLRRGRTDTVGLVVEQSKAHTDDHLLRWYCRACGQVLHDFRFQPADIGKGAYVLSEPAEV